jgi:dipeptidyl aminopeptidase/acylaminoacyl peptidase
MNERVTARPRILFLTGVAIATAALVVAAPVAAQDKPTVPAADYGKWETAGTAAFTSDGAWIAYPIRRVDETRELRLRAVADGATDQVFEWGERPRFSDDNRWLAWRIGISTAETERLRATGEPVRLAVGLVAVGDETPRTFAAVSDWAFDSSGRFLALLGYAPEEPAGKGSDLRIVDLDTDRTMTFGNVSGYAWSDTASRLALTIATGADEGNGVQLYDATSGVVQPLDSSGAAYLGLAWRDDAADLAVYRSAGAASTEATGHDVLAWRSLDTGVGTPTVLEASAGALPSGLEVVQHRTLEWADDGTRIAVGLRPVDAAEEEPADHAADTSEAMAEDDPASAESGDAGAEPDADEEEPELPEMQIWHTSDVRLYPAQKVSERRDAQRTLLAVWHLDGGNVVQIGTDLMERAELLAGWEYGVERRSAPYAWGTMFGRPYHDIWTVDANTGDRELTHERVRYSYSSAGGDYLATFDGEDYWSYRLADGARVNLTADLDVEFHNAAWDTPTDLLPPFGVGGWSEGDAAVFLYDEFDVWQVGPGGAGATRLSAGRADATVHRLARTDPEAGFFSNDPFNRAAPIFMTLRNERTEQRGYARLDPDADEVQRLMLEDRSYSRLREVGTEGLFAFIKQSRTDSPDYFVGDASLVGARQVTSTNPFQDDYAWTRSELVDFDSETGHPLQAALLYPANYDPSQTYPMIVYTYEILAPSIHSYQVPSERSYYNFTAWTQQGYFVLLPDIVYTWREPGASAIASVRAAVATIVERGVVDADRVGLIGHSWGGWQAAYLPTRVDTFAASVAGAPLTDFVSFMGQLHWNQGAAELSHWETGQARMEVPYWEDPEAHHRSSPIHKVQDMETPLLMAFGNEDGVVDWDQGTEFYNFARRAGKQMVLLVYEGEDHGFRNEANQKDYHRRILEWFGHYLKGDPAPAWITDGVQLDNLEAEKRRVATGKGVER